MFLLLELNGTMPSSYVLDFVLRLVSPHNFVNSVALLFFIFLGVFAAAFQMLLIYKVMRFFCLEFETNGFFDPTTYVLPWTSYPIQISTTAVEDGVVTHVYECMSL